MATFADITIRLGADLKAFSTDMQNAQRSLASYGKNLTKTGKSLTVGVTAPLLAFGGIALKTAADLETLETSLEVMTGSAEAGKKALADLSEFTATTPFQLEDVGNSAKQLLAFGFTVDQVKEKLFSIGDIAAGSGNGLGDISKIFGQISAAGKLTGERFNQLQERAVPIGSAIAKSMGVAESSVKDLISSGKVSFKDFETAFTSLSTSGGLFEGAMKKQSETIAGLFSTLKDNVQLALAEIGRSISDSVDLKSIVSGLTSAIRDAVKWFGTLSDSTKKFIVIMAGVAAAVGPLLALAGTILPAIGTGLALLTGPIGLVVAGLAAIGVVIYKYWDPIKATLIDIANYFIDLYNESTIFRLAVEAIKTTFTNVFTVGKFVFNSLWNLISKVAENVKNSFVNIGGIIKAVLTGNFKAIPGLLAKNFTEGAAGFKDFISSIQKDFEDLKLDIAANIGEGVDNALNGKKYALIGDNLNTDGVEEKISDAVKKGVVSGLSGSATASAGTPQTSKLTIDTKGIKEIGTTMYTGLIESIPVEEISDRTALLLDKMIDFRDGVSEILESAAGSFVSGFGEIVGAIASGNSSFASLGGFLLETLGGVLIQLGKLAITTAITIGAIKTALKTLNPVVALVAGAAAIALGTYIKSQTSNFAGSFANGGIVGGGSFSGDNLTARVNSGELILNVAQQKNLVGALSSKGSDVVLQPSLDFSMDKFRVGLERVANKRSRNT
ncbi:tail length tape measure protein [Cellulophaga phage phi39:1]|uniref:tail length tape measure protein n=1 Tax=Cellulophaga phage phi39:1 TaxID=1327993 RepID=UPI000351C92E|nr:tail length tape measure protein [Cellulophaga phage phi39:1]AGO49136.1 phage tape measure protein [Cellulophaga phage phi39:1]